MKRKPNILLVMCDDLGFGDVGFNGGTEIQTPCLDKLAGSGIRFERFYAGGPVCSPTRGTCLTGRHYIRYGINHANQGRLPVQERSLGQICKQQGYATGHFGKWHLGTLTLEGNDGNRGGEDPRLFSPPWLHGFDTCFSTESKVPTWDPMVTPDERGPKGPRWGNPGEPFGTHYWNERGEQVTENLEGCDSAKIVDRAETFIRQAVADEKPFLSVVWFHAPHTPVVAGEEWRKLYPEATEEEQHYFGCVSAMDAQMGRLQNLLKETGVLENTLIWFCSDNGPEGSGNPEKDGRSQGKTGGLRGRKRSLYEGGVGVPAFVFWPAGLERKGTAQGPFSTLDILPSCCEAMGVELSKDRPMDGVSILPLLKDQALKRSKPIPYRFLERRKSMFDSPTFAVMLDQWKFLTNLDPQGEFDQLYDLETDRFEENDLIEHHPDIQKFCREELNRFLDSCRRSHAGEDYDEPVDMISPFQEERGWRA
jgi:arylsulfatase A-like enzyme